VSFFVNCLLYFENLSCELYKLSNPQSAESGYTRDETVFGYTRCNGSHMQNHYQNWLGCFLKEEVFYTSHFR